MNVMKKGELFFLEGGGALSLSVDNVSSAAFCFEASSPSSEPLDHQPSSFFK